ncbi:MAG: hypothetical protein ACXIUB_10435 [Wenzhouxiangella sp.]
MRTRLPKARRIAFVPALALLVCLAGCASGRGTVSGQLPLVNLDSLELQDQRLLVDLSIRNLNDQRLETPLREASLIIDGQAAHFESSLPLSLNISARGRENLRLTATADSATLAALAALADERGQSLPYQLTLTFDGRRASRTPVEQSGFLHPVPGQPGRFR